MVMPVGSHAEEEKDEHSEIVEICIQAKEPGVCLKSYGYVCRQSRRFERSLEAYDLRCKLALPGGRYHFVQALHDDGGWAVENQDTYLPYLPEQDDFRTEAEDAGLALSNYVRDEMKSYRGGSGYSGSYGEPVKHVKIQTGTRKEDKYRVIRALCAMTFDSYPDQAALSNFNSDCETQLLRTIRMVSQPEEAGPFRAAGPSEIEWQSSRTVVLASADNAVVFDGRYVFESDQTPCQWISDCCSSDGFMYLDSCRVPTEAELQSVKSCLSQGLRPRSEDFFACMREANVKIGCDEQADGSRICY